MHIDQFVRGKGRFMITKYVPTDERSTRRFPLLLTTGRILSQYNVGAQTRRTPNVMWHSEDVLEIHPQDAEDRGVAEGDWVGIQSRAGETVLRATLTDRVQPGVVYTTFHFPESGANVVTTDSSDWATNCPEYKVTAVQVTRVSQPSEWQRQWSRFADIQHSCASGPRERRGDDGEMMPSRRARTARRQRRHTLPAATIRTQSMSQPAEDRHDSIPAQVTRIRAGAIASATEADHLAEETPVALEYNGISHATMLATPADLEDFALGFAVRGHRRQRRRRARHRCGAAMRRHRGAAGNLQRLRGAVKVAPRMAGRTGCGLCGVETLPEVLRPVPPWPPARRAPGRAGRHARHAHAPAPARPDRRHHAAGWAGADGTIALVREDVGRHNALDKLVGALARHGLAAASGMVLVSSRASFEMVQKTAAAGVPVLAAVSAPTALAVRLAQEANITLLGFLRNDDATLYAHPERILS